MSEQLSHPGDWSPVELKQNADRLFTELETWFDELRQKRVKPEFDEPLDVIARFQDPLPISGTEFPTILDRTMREVYGGSTLWNHPGHHAYFSNSSSGPAILAEACVAALNPNVMVWDSAPAPAAVERQTLQWLADLAQISWTDPDSVLVDGASQATMYALAAARQQCASYDFRAKGASGGPRLRIYCSQQTHSSVDKAAIALGIGLDNVIHLADDEGLIDPSDLARQISQDREQGMTPLAVVATVGTTSTASIDPVERIAQVTRDNGVWLHLDAAYGGLWKTSSRISDAIPEMNNADSIVINPHKVLFCPMEVSALYAKRPGSLVAAFSLIPEYLKTTVADSRLDYMNYTTQLGRQFRALKVWWVIQSFGKSGIQERLDYAVMLADRLREKVNGSENWSVVNRTRLPLVCIQPVSDALSLTELDSHCEHVMHAVNASGHSAVSHTKIDGRYTIRISIGNIHTTVEDVDALWDQISGFAEGEKNDEIS